jgi:hypothetical protein
MSNAPSNTISCDSPFKNVREDGALVDKVDLILVELADFLQRFLVIRINKEKISGKEDVDNVRAATLEDRDAGVALP